ncbi:MAG TPA: hypothetical protein VGM69_01705 [Chloroflexota bacterium]
MADPLSLLDAPHTGVHRIFRRFLEPAQDVLVLGLGLALFALMVRTLLGLLTELLRPAIDFRAVIAEVLFMLVMVEVLRLLIVYLEEHRERGRRPGGVHHTPSGGEACATGV